MGKMIKNRKKEGIAMGGKANEKFGWSVGLKRIEDLQKRVEMLTEAMSNLGMIECHFCGHFHSRPIHNIRFIGGLWVCKKCMPEYWNKLKQEEDFPEMEKGLREAIGKWIIYWREYAPKELFTEFLPEIRKYTL